MIIGPLCPELQLQLLGRQKDVAYTPCLPFSSNDHCAAAIQWILVQMKCVHKVSFTLSLTPNKRGNFRYRGASLYHQKQHEKTSLLTQSKVVGNRNIEIYFFIFFPPTWPVKYNLFFSPRPKVCVSVFASGKTCSLHSFISSIKMFLFFQQHSLFLSFFWRSTNIEREKVNIIKTKILHLIGEKGQIK